jgi:hypothetical protein
MTRYQKGADKENELLRYFEYLGFTGCRSAGSHGNWDLIVSPPIQTPYSQETLHIQCGPKSKKEIARLEKIAACHCGKFAHVLFKFRSPPMIRDLKQELIYKELVVYVRDTYGLETKEHYFTVVKKIKKVKDKSS